MGLFEKAKMFPIHSVTWWRNHFENKAMGTWINAKSCTDILQCLVAAQDSHAIGDPHLGSVDAETHCNDNNALLASLLTLKVKKFGWFYPIWTTCEVNGFDWNRWSFAHITQRKFRCVKHCSTWDPISECQRINHEMIICPFSCFVIATRQITSSHI